jgi:hypothetical protein
MFLPGKCYTDYKERNQNRMPTIHLAISIPAWARAFAARGDLTNWTGKQERQ